MANTTPNRGLPSPAGGDAVNIYPGLAQSLATALDNDLALIKGLYATMPAASSVPSGTVYYATDYRTFSLADGTNWNLYPTHGTGYVYYIGGVYVASYNITQSGPLAPAQTFTIANPAGAHARLFGCATLSMTAVGTAAVGLTLDGVTLGWMSQFYFNTANVHGTIPAFEFRSGPLTPGSHTVQLGFGALYNGWAYTDGNDWCSFGAQELI